MKTQEILKFIEDNQGEKIETFFDKTHSKISELNKRIDRISFSLLLMVACGPDYTTDIPDSKENKERYVQYLKVPRSVDVSDIYCYCDYFGADYKVLISFNCDPSTVQNIARTKQMQKATEKGGGLIFGAEFKWWDKEKIESLVPYKEGKDLEYWKYIWYDSSAKRAYYLEYSM